MSAGLPAARATFCPWRCSQLFFAALFLEAIDEAFENDSLHFFGDLEPLRDRSAFNAYLAPLRKADRVVYAKSPFGGPQQALAYPGRYTHRVAISNHRLVSDEDGQVSFQWKDYRNDSEQKIMTVDESEFIRRFLIHTLPPGYQRIRHFGFLANCHRKIKLAICRKLLVNPVATLLPEPARCREMAEGITEKPGRLCPHCGAGTMIRVAVLPSYRWPAAPPPDT